MNPTRLKFKIMATVLVSAAACEAYAQRALYVAPDGNDANQGTESQPFATLTGARDAIRRMKAAGPLPGGGVIVRLRGGIYPLAGSFALGKRDSGTPGAKIVYRASEGEAVHLVGGQVVGGFTPVADPAVLERLDEAARGKVLQTDLRAQGVTDLGRLSREGYARPKSSTRLELFFNGRPMTLARWPNQGYATIAAVPKAPPVIDGANIRRGTASSGFHYSGDRPQRWTTADDVWVYGFWHHDWADGYEKVASIDLEKRLIATRPPHAVYGYSKGRRFYALNLLEELDSPGEWYLDRRSGVLYFWPPEPIEKATVMVSILPEPMVTLSNVSHVAIRDVILEVTRSDAVRIEGGCDNLVANCTIRNIGRDAVIIQGGTNHGVIGCHVNRIAASGIQVSGGDRKTLTPSGHHVESNHIHDYGQRFRTYSPAVRASGVGVRVARNLIHHAPHAGILFGGNDHLFEFNHIHHVALESGDVGAIYTGRDWTARGNVIRYNFFHDVHGVGMGSMGVYLDDCASGTTIFGNVFCRVRRAMFIGGGRDNTVENNVFVDCQPALQIDQRGKSWAAKRIAADQGSWNLYTRLRAMPYQKPPWSERYPKLVNILNEDPTSAVGNVIRRNICLGPWAELRPGVDALVDLDDNMVGQDPHFVDAANMNFQLRDDSPAWKTGFQKIPFEKIGPAD